VSVYLIKATCMCLNTQKIHQLLFITSNFKYFPQSAMLICSYGRMCVKNSNSKSDVTHTHTRALHIHNISIIESVTYRALSARDRERDCHIHTFQNSNLKKKKKSSRVRKRKLDGRYFGKKSQNPVFFVLERERESRCNIDI